MLRIDLNIFKILMFKFSIETFPISLMQDIFPKLRRAAYCEKIDAKSLEIFK